MFGSTRTAYRTGVGIALVTSFLIVWTTIVRDDDTGMGYFMIILAAGVGGFAAWFQSSGMARTMFGVAIMQTLMGIGVATAPVTALTPNGPDRALLFNGFFVLLWLVAAAAFRAAASGERKIATGQG